MRDPAPRYGRESGRTRGSGVATAAAAGRSVALGPGMDRAHDREAHPAAGLVERRRVGPGVTPAGAGEAAIRALDDRAHLAVVLPADRAHEAGRIADGGGP